MSATTMPLQTVATPTTTSGKGTPGVPPDVIRDDPEAILVPVLHDAAERTGADIGEVRIVDFVFRQWPDSSLGCPQEGKSYSPITSGGYRIVVEVEGLLLDYRLYQIGEFWLCGFE